VPPSRAPVLPTVIEVADGVAIVRCALAVGVIAIPAGWLATGIWVPVVFVDTVISVTVPASLVASTVFPSGVIAIPYARQTSSAGAEVLPESRRQRSGQRQLRLPRLARTGVPTAEKKVSISTYDLSLSVQTLVWPGWLTPRRRPTTSSALKPHTDSRRPPSHQRRSPAGRDGARFRSRSRLSTTDAGSRARARQTFRTLEQGERTQPVTGQVATQLA
jgi:hypothetical protein